MYMSPIVANDSLFTLHSSLFTVIASTDGQPPDQMYTGPAELAAILALGSLYLYCLYTYGGVA